MAQLIKGKQIAEQTITISGSTGNVIAQGDLDMSSYNVILTEAPTLDTQAANKAYVDSVAQGLQPHAPVLVISSTNLDLDGIETVDGVVLVADNSVLVNGQTDKTENGIYLVKAGAWTRREDADGDPDHEVALGDFVFVESGTTNASSGWVLGESDAADPTIDPGTDTQFWFKMAAPGSYSTDGEGIEINGSVFSLEIDGDTLTKTADGIRVAASLVTQVSTNQDNITSLATEISTSVESIDLAISNNDDDISSLETGISTDVESIDLAISNNDDDISSLETGISTDVESIDLAISNNDDDISSLDTALSTEISTTDSDVVSLSTALSTISGDTLDITTILANGEVLGLSGGELTGFTYSNDFTSIETALSTEISQTNSDVTSLSTGISDGGAGITSLDSALSTEISTTGVEVTSLDTAISTEISTTGVEVTSLDSALSTEISTTGVEVTSLDSALSTEISITGSEVTSLSTGISDSGAGITSLDSALSTEISTTGVEVTSLDTAISTEISTTGVEVTSLTSALSTEISTTGVEVTSLDSALSTEISTTGVEVTSLSTAIDSIAAPTYEETQGAPANAGSTTNVVVNAAGIPQLAAGESVDEDSVVVYLNGIAYPFEYSQGAPAIFYTIGAPTSSSDTVLYFDGVAAGFEIETDDYYKLKYTISS